MLSKIRTAEQIKKIRENLRFEGKKCAFANGGFDILHIGHVRYLQAAAKEADVLIVAINSDRSIRILKGEKRGIINQKGRARLISALKCVDYVMIFDELTVDKLLLEIKPDFHCKGSDYTEESVPERETVLSYGGKVRIVGGDKVRSSSEIISNLNKK